MIVVGLTGGIASGKSFVVGHLKKLKIPVHESDRFISSLYVTFNKRFVSFLQREGFEKSIIKNTINKKIIREDIFNNKEKKTKLEKYLHNEVKKNRNLLLKKNTKKKLVFLDIPLLFENNLENICDLICSTLASKKIREKRALKRAGMTKKIFNKIVKSQARDKERKKKSDYLINTSFTRSNTCLQADHIIYDVLIKKNK